MIPVIHGIIGSTKYEMPRRCANTPRPATEGLVPMRSKYTHTPTTSEYQIDPETGAVMVPLRDTQGEEHYALVDADDLPLVQSRSWRVLRARNTMYAYCNQSPAAMHRFILGLSADDPIVDHENRNGLDNRRSNLRPCTHSKNSANTPSRGSRYTQYRGVCWYERHQKWTAHIGVKGSLINLGYFKAEQDAARAYDAAALHHFGEFAQLNFPGSTPPSYESVIARIRKPSSQFRGLSRKGRVWEVTVCGKGQRRYIGKFHSEEEAARAYDAAARELLDDKARLNFPDESEVSQ